VHEWETNGARLRVVIEGSTCLEELDPQFGWCRNDYVDYDLADELARLAARVKELEEEADDYELRVENLAQISIDKGAEVLRLREALIAVDDLCAGSAYHEGSYIYDKVAAALREKDNGNGNQEG